MSVTEESAVSKKLTFAEKYPSNREFKFPEDSLFSKGLVSSEMELDLHKAILTLKEPTSAIAQYFDKLQEVMERQYENINVIFKPSGNGYDRVLIEASDLNLELLLDSLGAEMGATKHTENLGSRVGAARNA